LSDKRSVLEDLVALSQRLGEPWRELVILGEGNTSALTDEGTFFVKASGTQLATIGPEGFCEVDMGKALAILEYRDLSDQEILDYFRAACVDAGARVPSVETVLHASLLSIPGVRFVGHTHPVLANAILCSQNPELLVSGRLFPDDIVCTGVSAAYVPYTDPGLPLARAVRASIEAYRAEKGFNLKLILMQNHGIIAFGATAKEVEMITYMHVKSCKIALGAQQSGGVRFLTPENVTRICGRPDEKVREAIITGSERTASAAPKTQLGWRLHGAGVENLGGPDGPEELPVPPCGPDQVLARVDACGLCFSDLKIIKQGGDHPRLYHRDLAKEPIIMGHEVALTVLEVGQSVKGDFAPGDRFVVQADVYHKGVNLAFGYMLPGGYQEYVVLGDEVLRGDAGCYLIPIKNAITGHAQASLAEPWACVIRAYKAEQRTTFAPGGVVWIAGSKTVAGEGPTLGAGLESPEHPSVIVTTDVTPELFDLVGRKCAAWGAKHVQRDGVGAAGVETLRAELAPGGFSDVVLIGATDPALAGAASAALARHGALALVGCGPELPASVDIGRVHYEDTRHLGTQDQEIAAAYARKRPLTLLPGGKAWFVGAAGPMGQMHVQLAVEMDNGPSLIVGTDIDDARLEHLRNRLAPVAGAKGVRFEFFNPAKVNGGEAARMAELAPEGFDDIVVLAPVAKIVEAVWPYLGTNGLMNIFAGLPTGTKAVLDVAACAHKGARVIGTSGSSPDDLAETLAATETGKLNTNLSVAAVGGIEGFKDGIVATQAGTFPGKIVCYPHVNLPLTGLPELAQRAPAVAAKLGPQGEWTVEAEAELLKGFARNG